MSNEEAAGAEPTQEEIMQAIYGFTAEKMEAGVSHAEIANELVEKGMDQESADMIVQQVHEVHREAYHTAGKKNIMYGALWAVGGTVVTVASYATAAEGDAKYVVAWGAIVYGAIQIFVGLSRVAK